MQRPLTRLRYQPRVGASFRTDGPLSAACCTIEVAQVAHHHVADVLQPGVEQRKVVTDSETMSSIRKSMPSHSDNTSVKSTTYFQRRKVVRGRICNLRAAEVTGTAVGASFCRRDAQGVKCWWLEVTGKGNKTRVNCSNRGTYS